MKEKIFNNFSLKILSALFAVVLWMIIVNIYDPNTGFTISNVNVQLINTESLTDKNYTFEIVDGSKISVYVSGPKSVITDIKSSDIVATADLSQITAFADYVDIDVKVIKDGRVLNNVEVTPKTTAVRLDIENRVTKDFTVNAGMTGSVAAGYAVIGHGISQTTVKVTGAASLIEKIDEVRAVCDISGASGDVVTEVPLLLYDEEGNALDSSGLEMAKDTVTFQVYVRNSKTVPIRCEGTSGTPAYGYEVQAVELSMQEVTLAGDSTVLDNIAEVVIPADILDVESVSADKTVNVNIQEYVPEGVYVVSNGNVDAVIRMGTLGKREIAVNTGSIRIEGLSEGFTAQVISPAALRIQLTGSREVINSLTAGSLSLRISLDSLTEGVHTVAVEVSVPAGCTLTGSYEVQVQIEAEQTEPEQTDAEHEENSGTLN